MFPNMWTNTGGAAQVGETSLQTVIRELKEELNISANIDNLKYIASYMRKNDFVDVWILKDNLETANIIFQEEVQDAKWVSIEEFSKMIDNEKAVKSSLSYFKNYLKQEF